MALVPGVKRARVGLVAATAEPSLRAPEGSSVCYPRSCPDTAVLVLLVAGCDLRCVFCRSPQPQTGARPPTPDEALALLRGARRRRRLVVTGGEPTARDDLLALCGAARRAGFEEVQLQTHAGRLADVAFARALGRAGVTSIDLPLYAADPDVHDRVTGIGGSQARALAGAAAARACGLDVAVHVTSFADTLGELRGTLRLAVTAGARRVAVEPVALIDELGAYATETPRLDVMGDAIVDALLRGGHGAHGGRGPGSAIPLWHASVPPCALPAALRRRHPRLWRPTAVPRSGALPLGYATVLAAITGSASHAFGSACGSCGLRPGCPGVPAEYLRAFGDGALPARRLTGARTRPAPHPGRARRSGS